MTAKNRVNDVLLMLWLLANGVAVAGCLSPIALNRAVIAYDEAVTDSLAKQLLINIARARHHQAIHFTGVSNVTATFDFRVNAGTTPALTGERGRALLPLFGTSVAENPTFSIVPIEGEEFTRRLLTPFAETKVMLLLRQRFDVDLLLRLMAQEVRLKEGRGERSFVNIPADKAGYETFRRVVLHLSAIQDQNQLYAEPLMYTRSWTIPGDAITAEGFQVLEKEYFVTYNVKDNTYTIKKEISGPIYMTNYDPDTLLPEERAKMIEDAKTGRANDVSFDIRPNHTGGEYPMKGSFRLRSFHTILTFLGRSLGEDPEYHVEKDARTPPVLENPANTMELVVSSSAPGESDLSIRSHRQYYAVNTSGPLARWNRDAFQLLYLLFQMTVTEVPRAGVPSITIAK